MMAEEQAKTQTLLAVLQARAWTKAERASARQEINRYHERKMASLHLRSPESPGLLSRG